MQIKLNIRRYITSVGTVDVPTVDVPTLDVLLYNVFHSYKRNSQNDPVQQRVLFAAPFHSKPKSVKRFPRVVHQQGYINRRYINLHKPGCTNRNILGTNVMSCVIVGVDCSLL